MNQEISLPRNIFAKTPNNKKMTIKFSWSSEIEGSVLQYVIDKITTIPAFHLRSICYRSLISRLGCAISLIFISDLIVQNVQEWHPWTELYWSFKYASQIQHRSTYTCEWAENAWSEWNMVFRSFETIFIPDVTVTLKVHVALLSFSSENT